MKLLNSKGFSLTEIMVAAGLLGVVSLGVMKMSKTSMMSAKTSESKFDMIAAVGEIRSLLSSPDACNNSFADLNASNSNLNAPAGSTGITELLNKDNVVKYKVGTKIGNVKIVSMSLSDAYIAPDGSRTEVVTGGIGDTYLNITFNKGKGTYGQDIRKRIKLWVETKTGTKDIANCRLNASGGGTGTIWERSTVDANDIFYSGRNVGIGTTDPQSTLDVQNKSDASLKARFVNSDTGTKARISVELDNEEIAGSNAGLHLTGNNYTDIAGWQDKLIVNSGSEVSGGVLIRPSVGGLTVSTTGASNPNLVVQDTTGHVGIGDADPVFSLTVKGKTVPGSDLTVGLYADGAGSTAGVIFASSRDDLVNVATRRDVAHIGLGTLDGQFGTDIRAGDFAIGSKTGRDIQISTRVDTNADGIADTSPTRLIVKNNGRVGIGTTTPNPNAKLDVNGGVKFGDAWGACNATREGIQRYNTVSKTMEYCNGTSWTSTTGGPVGGPVNLSCVTRQRSAVGSNVGHQVSVSCLANEQRTGGSCISEFVLGTSVSKNGNKPSGQRAWHCQNALANGFNVRLTVFAICCK